MTATLSDRIVAAIEDAERLTSRYEPNSIAVEDAHISTCVRAALNGPVPDRLRGTDYDDPAATVPLLRFVNARRAPVPLLDAALDPPSKPQRCDRCTAKVPTHRLIVPAGASAVALHFCTFHRDVLTDMFGHGLVWD